jgi:hypothetical protein
VLYNSKVKQTVIDDFAVITKLVRN